MQTTVERPAQRLAESSPKQGGEAQSPDTPQAVIGKLAEESAAGLGGFLQMGIAALVAQVVGSIQDGTPYPMAIGMTVCALAALISAQVAVRANRRVRAAP